MDEVTDEDVAALLSLDEGRTVTVLEVRRITCTALRKLRHLMQERGLSADDLFLRTVGSHKILLQNWKS